MVTLAGEGDATDTALMRGHSEAATSKRGAGELSLSYAEGTWYGWFRGTEGVKKYDACIRLLYASLAYSQ